MKRQYLPRDERRPFIRSILNEFFSVFIVVFVNVYIMVFLYNKLLTTNFSVMTISLFMLLNLFFACALVSVAIYFFRVRVLTNGVHEVCRAAQKVARGDFTVRVKTRSEKKTVNTEIDLLKLDFNKMVEELASLETLRDDFIADVSHEIKTPLSVIQGYADLLQSSGISETERSEYTVLLDEAVHKLNSLVTNLLKLNKVENSGIIKFTKFDLGEQLRDCVLDVIDKAEEKGISFEIDIEDAVVENEQTMLELVWKNLLSNAVKFTEGGGTIKVGLKANNKNALITVADTGCGMSEETLEHIFDKFYQGDTSHSQEGNGLGLAIVDRIVSLTNCKLKVKSRQGAGTRFEVVVPYSPSV